MVNLNDILGYKNRKIYQNDDYFSFSLDSVILANFCSIRKRDKYIYGPVNIQRFVFNPK